MLLQSAGFLDIDKAVTYNTPLPGVKFWKRPATPQCMTPAKVAVVLLTFIVTVSRFDAYWMPEFTALRCTICSDVIRGVSFTCCDPECKAEPKICPGNSICESCYRESLHPPSHMKMRYKHYILRDIITPQISSQICHCSSVNRTDPYGEPIRLFPVNKQLSHRGTGIKTRGLKCGLLLLGDRVIEIKFQGLMSRLEKTKRVEEKQKAKRREQIRKNEQKTLKKKSKLTKTKRRGKTIGRPEQESPKALEEQTVSDAEDEKLAEKEVPYLYRKFTKLYPFGNVHMALTLGPLMIENGVPGRVLPPFILASI